MVKKEKKVKEQEKDIVQLNIFTDADTRKKFHRMCRMRGWTHGEGLKAVMDFVDDVRVRPKNAKAHIEKHGLGKISE